MTIYIREAHACDEWQVWFNDRENLCYAQPDSLARRAEIARDFLSRTDSSIALFVDGIDDRAMELYGSWPERLYGIGGDGRIEYQGAAGPWRFRPGGLEHWLESRRE